MISNMGRSVLFLLCTGFLTLAQEPAFDPSLARRATHEKLASTIHQNASHLLEGLKKNKQPQTAVKDELLDALVLWDYLLQKSDPNQQSPAVGSARQKCQSLAQALTLQGKTESLRQQLAAVLSSPQRLNGQSITPRWGDTIPLKANSLPSIDWSGPAAQIEIPRESSPLNKALPDSAPALLSYFEQNISYEPYYGRRKSTQAVLADGCGNDADIAAAFLELAEAWGATGRLNYGLVNVPIETMLNWLRLGDLAAVDNTLRAAEIPFEWVFDNQAVRSHIQIERVWLELYLPITNYRGNQVGAGDRAWLAIDPASGTWHADPQWIDPLEGLSIDAVAWLNQFQDQENRDAASWLNQQMLDVAGSDLSTMADRWQNNPDLPNILPLSLPYEVIELRDTWATIPASFHQKVLFRVTDETGLEVHQYETSMVQAYRQALIWDAVPYDEVDRDLVTQYGNRWRVPAQLLRLSPAIRLGDFPLTRAAHGFEPGALLTLEVGVALPGQQPQWISKNPLRVGGYTVFGFQSAVGVLAPDSVTIPEDFYPFGNYMRQMLTGYLQDSMLTEHQIGAALGIRPVHATPHFAMLSIDHVPTMTMGDDLFLQPSRIVLDADARPTRAVPEHANIPDSRTGTFQLLAGLVAAQNEATKIDHLGESVNTLSVPDLLKEANSSGVAILDLTSADIDQIPFLPFSTPFLDQIRDLLVAGSHVRLPQQPVSIDAFVWEGARALFPQTGQSIWLLNHSESGGSTSSAMSDFPPESEEPIQQPVHYFESAYNLAYFVALDRTFQDYPADSGELILKFEAYDYFGKLIRNRASYLLDPIKLDFYVESISDDSGVVSFTFTPPTEILADNPSYELLEEPNQDVVAYHYYFVSTDPPENLGPFAFAGVPVTVRVVPGEPSHFRGRYYRPTDFGVDPSIIEMGPNDKYKIVFELVDAKQNPIANQAINLEVEHGPYDICQQELTDLLDVLGYEQDDLTPFLYRDADERDSKLKSYSLDGGPLDRWINIERGMLNQQQPVDGPGEAVSYLVVSSSSVSEWSIPIIPFEIPADELPEGLEYSPCANIIWPNSVLGPSGCEDNTDEFVFEDACTTLLEREVDPCIKISSDIEFNDLSVEIDPALQTWPAYQFLLTDEQPTVTRAHPLTITRKVSFENQIFGPPYSGAPCGDPETICGITTECELVPTENQTLEFQFIRSYSKKWPSERFPDQSYIDIYTENQGEGSLVYNLTCPGIWTAAFMSDFKRVEPTDHHYSPPHRFAVMSYAVGLAESNIPEFMVNVQNQLTDDVTLDPLITPTNFIGAANHTWEIYEDGRRIQTFAALSPAIKIAKNSYFDPTKSYAVQLFFNVDENRNPGQSYQSGRIPIKVVRDKDLIIRAIENDAWIYKLNTDSAAAKDKRLDCEMDTDRDVFTAFEQQLAVNQAQEYDQLEIHVYDYAGLEPFLIHPVDPSYVTGQNLRYLSLPADFEMKRREEYEFELVGIKQGDRTLSNRIAINARTIEDIGVAAIDEDGLGFDFDPNYVYHMEIDPTSINPPTPPSGRKIGFETLMPGVITFALGDGTTYVFNEYLEPGNYIFDLDMTPGKRTWNFDAVFTTQSGMEVPIHRTGKVEIVQKFRSGLRVGDTQVKNVSLTNGSFSTGFTDIAYPGRGPTLEFNRSYNSAVGINYNPMGIGWTHNYLTRIVKLDATRVKVLGGDGSGLVFTRGGNGYEPEGPGNHAQLFEDPTTHVLTLRLKSGMRYEYGPLIHPEQQREHPFTYFQNFKAIVDPFGNRLTCYYNTEGHISRVTDSSGRSLVFHYEFHTKMQTYMITAVTTLGVTPSDEILFTHDEWGRLLKVQRDAREDNYTYLDPCLPEPYANNMASHENANGLVLNIDYHSVVSFPNAPDPGPGDFVRTLTEHPEFGQPPIVTHFDFTDDASTVWDAIATTYYEFNFHGQATRIEGPLGIKSMDWAVNDVLLMSETNEAGQFISYGYDEKGNLTFKSLAGSTETWVYDQEWNKPQLHVDAIGTTTTWQIDPSNGSISSQRLGSQITTRFEYARNGDLIEITDPNGNRTHMSYDRYGMPATKTLPDNYTITTVHDSRGRVRQQSESNGLVKRFDYNGIDQLVAVTASADASQGINRGFGYKPLGQITLEINGSLTTVTLYDFLNRPLSIDVDTGPFIESPNIETTYRYDIHGNKTFEQTGNRTYIYQYDDADRLEFTTLNGFFFESRSYLTGTELIESETDWRGATTQYTYDARLNLKRLVLPTNHTLHYSFDAVGLKRSESDANGNETRYSYDAARRLDTIDQPLGHSILHTYDPNGNLVSQTNTLTGAGFERNYDSRNRLTHEIRFNQPDNQVTIWSYNQHDREVVEHPPLDGAITRHINELGQLTSESQEGFGTSWHYNENGHVDRSDHADGSVTLTQRDALGRPITENAPLGYTTTWSYDVFGNTLSSTDARGIQTSTNYDVYNRPLTTQRLLDGLTVQESFAYTQNQGNVAETYTNLHGHVTTRHMDARGRLTRVVDSLRGTATQGWDGENMVGAVDFRGITTTLEYDALNRVHKQIITSDGLGGETVSKAYIDDERQVITVDAKGIETQEFFDQLGNLIAQDRAQIRLIENHYDQQNRVIETLDATARLQRYTYNLRGLLSSNTVGELDEATTTTYSGFDALGRATRVQDALGRGSTSAFDFYDRPIFQENDVGTRSEFEYDASHNTIEHRRTSPSGALVSTHYSYDILNQLISVTEPNDALTSYHYANQWKTLSVTDAENETTTWSYDSALRLTSVTRPGNGSSSFGYDGNDNQISLSRDTGQAVLDYDYANRLKNENWNGDGGTLSFSRDYDANGNLTQVSQTDNRISDAILRHIEYDDLNRPTRISTTLGGRPSIWVELGYEDNGNRSLVTRGVGGDHGLAVSYAYDSANRLVLAELVEASLPLGDVQYAYHGNGLLAQMSLFNGVTSDWDYDDANRLQSLTHSTDGASISDYQLDYYPDGSRQSLIEDHGVHGLYQTSYDYDDRARLTGWQRTSPNGSRITQYNLDAVGNRLFESETEVGSGTEYTKARNFTLLPGHRIGSFTESVDDDGQITDVAQFYNYDACGNRTQSTRNNLTQSTLEVSDYDWDPRHRMRTVTVDGSPLTFDYDDLDRRVRKSGDSRTGDPILYLWDEMAVLSEYADLGDGNAPDVLAQYAFGLMRLAQFRPGQATAWLGHDPMGSASLLTDDAGSTLSVTSYDPFGTQTKLFDGGESWNREGFTGHEYDPETKLTYAKARFYDQDLGIFLGQDPELGNHDTPPSLHRYLYANANPLTYYDPTGRETEDYEGGNQQDELGYDGDEITKARRVVPDTVNSGAKKTLAGVNKAVEVAGYVFTPLGEIETLANPDSSKWELIAAGVFLTPAGKVVKVTSKFFGFVKKYHVVGSYHKAERAANVVDEGHDALKAEKRALTTSTGVNPSKAGQKFAAAMGHSKPVKDEAKSLAIAVGQSNHIDDAASIRKPTKSNKQKGQDFAETEHQQELENTFANLGQDDPRKSQKKRIRTSDLRAQAGTAIGSGEKINGKWLRGTHGNAGFVPERIASTLRGREFADFKHFREEFWMAVADDVELAGQFSRANVTRMKGGYAPRVVREQTYGSQRSYILHHRTPIQHGGGVYDLDNVVIVTPRYHQEILDPSRHFRARSD